MRTFVTLFIAFAVICLMSCNKVSHNGHLDGQWQLMEIEYSDGHTVTPSSTYYCINLHTVNLVSSSQSMAPGNMVYDKSAGTIDIEFPRTSLESLATWGINENPAHFEVRTLTRSSMVLETGGNILTFRKF